MDNKAPTSVAFLYINNPGLVGEACTPSSPLQQCYHRNDCQHRSAVSKLTVQQPSHALQNMLSTVMLLNSAPKASLHACERPVVLHHGMVNKQDVEIGRMGHCCMHAASSQACNTVQAVPLQTLCRQCHCKHCAGSAIANNVQAVPLQTMCRQCHCKQFAGNHSTMCMQCHCKQCAANHPTTCRQCHCKQSQPAGDDPCDCRRHRHWSDLHHLGLYRPGNACFV